MSKIKKKPIDRSSTTVSKEDIHFERIIQFAGFFFFIAFAWFMCYWAMFDFILESENVEIGTMQYSYIIFTGASTAFCFALVSKIRQNRDIKKKIFIDWIIAQFLFCMFAIFVVAIYRW